MRIASSLFTPPRTINRLKIKTSANLNRRLHMTYRHTSRIGILAGALALAATVNVQAQTAGTNADSTTDSKAFAAGRHADGGTGVRKAESSTTTSTGGSATGSTAGGGSAESSSTAGTGGSAAAGSGVSASTVGTGGSSAGTQSNDGSTATRSSGPGASATASGPSGTSSSDQSGSKADPARGASGYARDHDRHDSADHGKHTAPGQMKKKEKKND
jgi:hypothetical protein